VGAKEEKKKRERERDQSNLVNQSPLSQSRAVENVDFKSWALN
jgi:hypothetical protein